MKNNKVIYFILATAIISGFSIFINKYGVSVVNPYVFAWLKNMLVAIILIGVIVAWKDRKSLRALNFKNWLMLLVIGIIGGGIPFLMFFKGLSLVSAAEGAFIHKTMFIYAAILGIIFLGEKITKKFFVAGLFLILGNILLLKNFHFTFGLGSALVLGATILWAIENVISRLAMKEISWRIVASARMFFGSIFILFFLLATNQASLISGLGAKQIGWTVITALLLLGYVLTWYRGLKEVRVGEATAILVLGAPITTVLNLVAGKAIGWQEFAASGLILLGVFTMINIKDILGHFKNKKEVIYVRA